MRQKIIYILGSGRSGTTLLEIAIGNSINIFDAGELIRFFKLNGKPHGFPEQSENYTFWKKVNDSFFGKNPGLAFSEIYDLFNSIESNKYFLINLFSLRSIRKYSKYKRLLNDLFASIFENITDEVIIDSSKTPGRALGLYRHSKYQVFFIYIKRNPKGVVKSYGKKEVEQSSKSFLNANVFYFLINLYSNLLKTIIPKHRFISITYENFVRNPVNELKKIQTTFDIDLSRSVKRIENKQSLEVGLLFDGNRIRLKPNIYIHIDHFKYRQNIRNIITDIFNGIWFY